MSVQYREELEVAFSFPSLSVITPRLVQLVAALGPVGHIPSILHLLSHDLTHVPTQTQSFSG